LSWWHCFLSHREEITYNYGRDYFDYFIKKTSGAHRAAASVGQSNTNGMKAF
jgi:hypothetical protein